MILPSFNLVTGGYDIRNLDLDVEKDKIRLFSVYNETIGEITKILR